MSHHHTQHANLTCYVLSFESCSQEKMQHQLSSEVQKKSTELLKTQRQMASMASELRAKNAELEELHTKNTALAMTEMHNKHAREENRRLLDEQQKRFLQLRAPQQARPRDDATDTSTPVTPAVVSDDVGRAGAGEESTGAAFTPVPKFTFREIYARGGGRSRAHSRLGLMTGWTLSSLILWSRPPGTLFLYSSSSSYYYYHHHHH